MRIQFAQLAFGFLLVLGLFVMVWGSAGPKETGAAFAEVLVERLDLPHDPEYYAEIGEAYVELEARRGALAFALGVAIVVPSILGLWTTWRSGESGLPPMPAPKRRWLKLTFLGMAALWFAACGGKVNPGGPFISLTHDIIPFGVAVFVLVAAVPCLRDKGLYGQLLALVPMFPATRAIADVVINVLDFWTRAAARGDLIGF